MFKEANVRDWIRDTRKEKKMTQENLAYLAKISTRTLQEWERGNTRITLCGFLAILDVLGKELVIKDKE